MSLSLRVHGATHPGSVHPKNEDSYAILPLPGGALLLIVCDGMGGMGRGDQASKLAVQVLTDAFLEGSGSPTQRMMGAITRADEQVRQALNTTGEGWAGSTAVMAFVEHDEVFVAWVGDSRVYHVRDGRVIDRTKDHKLVQELVDSGQLTAAEAHRSTLSSVITRALGGRPPGAPTVIPAALDKPWRLRAGDRVLLCSDGLSDLVTDEELPELLAARTVEAACNTLVATAIERGGHDNITTVLLASEVEGAETAETSRRERSAPDAAVVLAFLAALGVATWLAISAAR